MTNLKISDSRLKLAVEAATEAGSISEAIKHKAESRRKEDDSVVTEADEKAEKAVREMLTENSDYPILGEEYGGEIEKTGTYWVVDPIDGTYNYSMNQPIYGSAVALVEDGEPTVGAFYMPELDYLFYAVEGEGAYRNQTELSVSNETDINDAYFMVTGIGRNEVHSIVKEFNEWVQQIGCAVAGEGWIASKWCDVGVFASLKPWDMAVGVILIREAGGVVKSIPTRSTDWEDLQNGKVILGNENIVNSVFAELSEDNVQTINKFEY